MKDKARKNNIDADVIKEKDLKKGTDVKTESDGKKGREEVVIKYGFIALGIILIICVLAFAIISIVPNNALSVGDYKISEEEFEYHYFEQKNLLYQQILEYYPDVSETVFLQSEYASGMTYHEFAKQLALERISDIYILLDLVKETEYVYDTVELEDSKDNFKASFEEYATQLGQSVNDVSADLYGCDFKIVLGIYEKTWISSKYQDDMLLEYESGISEEEMTEYYEVYKDEFDQVTLKQLFITTYDTDAQAYFDEAGYLDSKARAEAILERVNNGENFDKLVLELSEDPAVIETLGEYTSRKNEIGLATLADWAFTTEDGVIELVETEIGFHVVKLVERTGYDDAKDSVRSNIAFGKMLQLLTEKKSLPKYEIGYYDAFNRY